MNQYDETYSQKHAHQEAPFPIECTAVQRTNVPADDPLF